MSATGDAEKTAVEQPPADAPPAEQPAEKPAKEKKKPKAPKEKKPKAPKAAAHPPYFDVLLLLCSLNLSISIFFCQSSYYY